MKNIFNFLKDSTLKILKNPQIYKFMIVGIVNAIFLLILTIILTDFLNVYYLFSSIIAYEITIIFGFILNENWTFSEIQKTQKRYIRFLKYNLFYFAGLLINSILVFVFTDITHVHYSLSQLFAIIFVFFFNYLTSKKITFKN